eukprot:TRINITY_DN345_c0_g1_i1.p1 TRINITY_DN345_c0_g1~~TRINITY_DN345_c0_g1_i1.p1  ORF type:complete len:323 (-),score=66.61 TRINITY_DN345_c0_g1_i1:158-1126(-)
MMRADCSVLFDSKTVIRKEFVQSLPLAMSFAQSTSHASGSVTPPSPRDESSSAGKQHVISDAKYTERLFFAPGNVIAGGGGDSISSSSRVDSIWSNSSASRISLGGDGNVAPSVMQGAGNISLYSLGLEEDHHKEDMNEYCHSLIRRLQGELQQCKQRTEYLEKRNRSLEDQLLELSEKNLNLERKVLAMSQERESFGAVDRSYGRSSPMSGDNPARHSASSCSSHHRSGRPPSAYDADSVSMSSQDREQAAVRATIESYSSRGICRHYIQGRCRYKAQCKFSHEVDQCPFCQESLPRSKIASSTHLARCFKLVTQSEYSAA